MVFGVAFGVPLLCCIVAALLSFFVSVSLITYKRFFGLRQASRVALTAVSEPPGRRVRQPAIITFAGFAVLIASTKFGLWPCSWSAFLQCLLRPPSQAVRGHQRRFHLEMPSSTLVCPLQSSSELSSTRCTTIEQTTLLPCRCIRLPRT